MPLYDVECQSCGKLFEIFCCIKDLPHTIINQKCPNCKGEVKQVITQIKRDWFRVHVNEDFDGTPITITSKKHLKDLCKKHGVQSKALL